MQIDNLIDQVHKLSRVEPGYVLKDEDRKLLARAANEMSVTQLAMSNSFDSAKIE